MHRQRILASHWSATTCCWFRSGTPLRPSNDPRWRWGSTPRTEVVRLVVHPSRLASQVTTGGHNEETTGQPKIVRPGLHRLARQFRHLALGRSDRTSCYPCPSPHPVVRLTILENVPCGTGQPSPPAAFAGAVFPASRPVKERPPSSLPLGWGRPLPACHALLAVAVQAFQPTAIRGVPVGLRSKCQERDSDPQSVVLASPVLCTQLFPARCSTIELPWLSAAVHDLFGCCGPASVFAAFVLPWIKPAILQCVMLHTVPCGAEGNRHGHSPLGTPCTHSRLTLRAVGYFSCQSGGQDSNLDQRWPRRFAS